MVAVGGAHCRGGGVRLRSRSLRLGIFIPVTAFVIIIIFVATGGSIARKRSRQQQQQQQQWREWGASSWCCPKSGVSSTNERTNEQGKRAVVVKCHVCCFLMSQFSRSARPLIIRSITTTCTHSHKACAAVAGGAAGARDSALRTAPTCGGGEGGQPGRESGAYTGALSQGVSAANLCKRTNMQTAKITGMKRSNSPKERKRL